MSGGRAVQPDHPREVVLVHELRHIAEAHAVLRAHILVLAAVVLLDLRESHRGEARLVEGGVVPAPEEPVGACMVSSEGACAAHYSYGRFRDIPVRVEAAAEPVQP